MTSKAGGGGLFLNEQMRCHCAVIAGELVMVSFFYDNVSAPFSSDTKKGLARVKLIKIRYLEG